MVTEVKRVIGEWEVYMCVVRSVCDRMERLG